MRKINTGDVFKMARLLKNTNVMDAVKDAYKAAKREDVAEGAHKGDAGKGGIWVDAAMKVLASCTSQQAEEQFYDLMAGICENKPEDIRNRPLDGLIEDVRRICEENNVANFLRSASDFAEKL
ncbi:hypothetical protein [uncultured Acetatifactor sp.]|uniref:hypothetical protein n=1 Tax=uncultured Acetatifactor sp. TaxID=1671927 RepID=UPI002629727D|nr:hypothetical protein [uncultured Acetatifactor sp.]